MDAIILPTCSHVAAPHGHYGCGDTASQDIHATDASRFSDFLSDVGNTVIFNALDYSSAVIPASYVDSNLDQGQEDWTSYRPNSRIITEGGKPVAIDQKNHALCKQAIS
jgi:hypothetical protein